MPNYLFILLIDTHQMKEQTNKTLKSGENIKADFNTSLSVKYR